MVNQNFKEISFNGDAALFKGKEVASAMRSKFLQKISLSIEEKLGTARQLAKEARSDFGGSSSTHANPNVAQRKRENAAKYSPADLSEIDGAILHCNAAIAAWLQLLPIIRETPSLFEANLMLGELYAKRGKLFGWKFCRGYFQDIEGNSALSEQGEPLKWLVKELRCNARSLSYTVDACLCEAQPGFSMLQDQPLKSRLGWALEYLSVAYRYLSTLGDELGVDKAAAGKFEKMYNYCQLEARFFNHGHDRPAPISF